MDQIAKSERNVRLILIFSKRRTPNKNSTVTTNIAIGNASFSRKGILNTEGEKYSSSLKENPTGSTAFTKPDIINTIATKTLINLLILYNIWCLVNQFCVFLLICHFNQTENSIVQHIKIVGI